MIRTNDCSTILHYGTTFTKHPLKYQSHNLENYSWSRHVQNDISLYIYILYTYIYNSLLEAAGTVSNLVLVTIIVSTLSLSSSVLIFSRRRIWETHGLMAGTAATFAFATAEGLRGQALRQNQRLLRWEETSHGFVRVEGDGQDLLGFHLGAGDKEKQRRCVQLPIRDSRNGHRSNKHFLSISFCNSNNAKG